MFKEENRWMIDAMQADVDKRWKDLLAKEEMTNKKTEE